MEEMMKVCYNKICGFKSKTRTPLKATAQKA